MFVKGVSHIREQNDCNYDYELVKKNEANGIRVYIHQYMSGYHEYYDYMKVKDIVDRIKAIRNEMANIEA
jgi:hypothetical protein